MKTMYDELKIFNCEVICLGCEENVVPTVSKHNLPRLKGMLSTYFSLCCPNCEATLMNIYEDGKRDQMK